MQLGEFRPALSGLLIVVCLAASVAANLLAVRVGRSAQVGQWAGAAIAGLLAVAALPIVFSG